MPILETLRLQSSVDDAKSGKFWRGCIAEFIGTALFLFVGIGGVRYLGFDLGTSKAIHIGFVIGLTLATVIWICADVSGAHINPAVTLATLATRRISLLKFVVYVLVQIIGAIVGVALLKAVSPAKPMDDKWGCTLINEKIGVTVGQGFLVEVIITFMLVMTVFAACDSVRNDLKGSAPLAIGVAVFVGHLFALEYTGASMNPARSIGSAAIEANWENHWVYWFAPAIGAVLAGWIYEIIFAANTSRRRICACLKDGEYDPDCVDQMTVTTTTRTTVVTKNEEHQLA